MTRDMAISTLSFHKEFVNADVRAAIDIAIEDMTSKSREDIFDREIQRLKEEICKLEDDRK